MSKIKEAIGLDIGSKTIKYVHIRRQNNSVEILDLKVINCEQNGSSKLELLGNIPKIIKSLGKNIPTVASIEDRQVFTRVFKLPAVGKSKLAKIVGYEAEQQVPFPIADVVWSYQYLRKVNSEEADVVLVAVKKDIIDEFITNFRKLGVSVDDIIAPVVGFYHLLEHQLSGSTNATLVLDLGAKTTNIVIIEDKNLWFRTVPLGGDIITQTISNEFNLSITDAERFKEENGNIIIDKTFPDIETDKKISFCIVRSISRLIGEISRSIEVYSSSFNSLGIKKIYVTGGTSNLGNINKFLEKKFRVDVETLDIGKSFEIKQIDVKKKFSENKSKLAIALGLALQGVGLAKLDLSLMPKVLMRKKQWRKRQVYISVICFLLVFMGVSSMAYNTQLSNIYKANIQKIKSEKKALDFNKKEIIKINNKIKDVKSRLDVIDEVVVMRTLWANMLLELEKTIPQDVWLTEIKPIIDNNVGFSNVSDVSIENLFNKDYLDIEIKAKTTGKYQQVVKFRDALNNSLYFVKEQTVVASANPPVDGIRDFIIEVRLDLRAKKK